MMKKLHYLITFAIACLFLAAPCRAQNRTSNAEIKYEIKHVYTGTVNETLDSVYKEVCLIYNAKFTGHEKLLVLRQNDTLMLEVGNGKGNGFSYITNKDYTEVTLGYTDPDNPVLNTLIISDKIEPIKE